MTGSWKTTAGGLATALGAACLAAAQMGGPSWLSMLGAALSVFGPALLGVTARDNSVSSEQAGAKK